MAASEDSPQVFVEEERPRAYQTGTKRNYWAKVDPSEFVTYPRMDALSYYEEMTLIRKAQSGDLSARNEVWQRNLRLVFSVVNQFYIPHDLLPDALQEGVIGIQRAISKFDLERYGKFSTYAWPWIWQHIQRFLHSRAFPSRIPSHLARPYSQFRREMLRATSARETMDVLERWRESHSNIFPSMVGIHRISTACGLHLVPVDCLPVDEERDVHDQLDSEKQISAAVRTLIGREKHILIRRFAMDGRPEATLVELGAELQITRERVRQIEADAVNRLKRHLQTQPMEKSRNVDLDASTENSDREESCRPYAVVDCEAIDLDQIVSRVLKECSTRQENATVHYYGLFGNPPVSVPEIASLLGIPTRRTAVAIRQGCGQLLMSLSHRLEPEIRRFVEKLHSDRSWEQFLGAC